MLSLCRCVGRAEGKKRENVGARICLSKRKIGNQSIKNTPVRGFPFGVGESLHGSVFKSPIVSS